MAGYKHYIRVDENNIVTYRFSDAFETPQEGDICVAEDAGRHYNDPFRNERGQFLYMWDGSQQVERTQAELDAEWDARPIEPDPDEELAAAIEAATTLPELKSALLGNGGLARVKGKRKL